MVCNKVGRSVCLLWQDATGKDSQVEPRDELCSLYGVQFIWQEKQIFTVAQGRI